MKDTNKKTRIFHMCISIRGALKNTDAKLRNMFTDKDGSKLPADEIRDGLLDKIADGWEVLPIGKECDNFDKKKGCQGHIKHA